MPALAAIGGIPTHLAVGLSGMAPPVMASVGRSGS